MDSRVRWTIAGKSATVCNTSRVRWGTAPPLVYNEQPGVWIWRFSNLRTPRLHFLSFFRTVKSMLISMKQTARHVAESFCILCIKGNQKPTEKFIMIALLKDKNEKWNANKEETLIYGYTKDIKKSKHSQHWIRHHTTITWRILRKYRQNLGPPKHLFIYFKTADFLT